MWGNHQKKKKKKKKTRESGRKFLGVGLIIQNWQQNAYLINNYTTNVILVEWIDIDFSFWKCFQLCHIEQDAFQGKHSFYNSVKHMH